MGEPKPTYTVVAKGPKVHRCNPGYQLGETPGTVVRCECGQLWVARAFVRNPPRQLRDWVYWRKATWRERRRFTDA